MSNKILTKNQIDRLPKYLSLLKEYRDKGIEFVNAQEISVDLMINQEVVKKDISAVSTQPGIPNKGREINALIRDFEIAVNEGDIHNAILLGVGNLGKSLINYSGFEKFSLKIVAAFDSDEKIIGQTIKDVNVLDIKNFVQSFDLLNAKIVIVCVPEDKVNEIRDMLNKCKVGAIWNLTQQDIILKNKEVINVQTNLAKIMQSISKNLLEKKEENNGNR